MITKICCCFHGWHSSLKIMDKKIRKNIKKEFQKIVKNIAGESSQEHKNVSRFHELEANVVAENLPRTFQTRTTSSSSAESNAVSLECCELSTSDSATSDSRCKKNIDGRQESDAGNSASVQSIVYDPLEDLSMNFYSILEKEYFSDVTIECGSDVLKAHKIVLCARSPVFEAMFTNRLQESEDGVVIIEDIEPEVLRDFLYFVYGGRLKDLTVAKACDLLYAAEKYQIRTLKQLCINYLRSNLSVENAFQILECANLYDTQLRSCSLKYICDHFSVVEATEEWKVVQIKNPALALEVYSTVVKTLQRKN